MEDLNFKKIIQGNVSENLYVLVKDLQKKKHLKP